MFDFTTDDSFEIEKTIQYELSIQVSLDGFSFTAFDTFNKKVVAFKTTPVKISSNLLLVRHLKDWLESESFLEKRFKNIRIFIFTAIFTLVPEEFSGDKLPENSGSLLFHEDATTELIENKIAVLGARLIFTIQSDLISLLNQFFNVNLEILHPLTALLSNQVKSEKRNCAAIITTQKFFFLTVYRNGKLLLANSYPYLHYTDLVYNVLNSFQQVETARSATELFICDVMNKNKKIEDLLKPYFNHISKLKTGPAIVNHPDFNHSIQLYLSAIEL
ncbi:MAG: hypothetical protein FD181_2791 [Prolixibacteraceae bacterium]|nr:MAG: hypothetical protein FD181_2791 [Prolixibacteraceae bacterium]